MANDHQEWNKWQPMDLLRFIWGFSLHRSLGRLNLWVTMSICLLTSVTICPSALWLSATGLVFTDTLPPHSAGMFIQDRFSFLEISCFSIAGMHCCFRWLWGMPDSDGGGWWPQVIITSNLWLKAMGAIDGSKFIINCFRVAASKL